MSSDRDKAFGIVGSFVLEELLAAIVLVFLVRGYAEKSIGFGLKALVWLVWFISFTMMNLVPADVVLTYQRRCLLEQRQYEAASRHSNTNSSRVNVTPGERGNSSIRGSTSCYMDMSDASRDGAVDFAETDIESLWATCYWLVYALVYVIVPLVQMYVYSGHVRSMDRAIYSLCWNIKYYAVFLLLGIAFILWYVFAACKGGCEATPSLSTDAVRAFLVTCSNTYGLVIIALFMGTGLVEIPRTLWREASSQLTLKACLVGRDSLTDLSEELDANRLAVLADVALMKRVVRQLEAANGIGSDTDGSKSSGGGLFGLFRRNGSSSRSKTSEGPLTTRPMVLFMNAMTCDLANLPAGFPLESARDEFLPDYADSFEPTKSSLADLRGSLMRHLDAYFRVEHMFTQVKLAAFFVQDVIKNSEAGREMHGGPWYCSCFAGCMGGIIWQSDGALYNEADGCFMQCRSATTYGVDEEFGEQSLTAAEGGSSPDRNGGSEGRSKMKQPSIGVRIFCCGGLSDTRARQWEWMWNVHIRAMLLRLVFAFTLLLSVATVFSESFMWTNQDPDLSLFHLLLRVPGQSVQSVETKVFICCFYMLAGLFWAISRFRVGNLFRMVWDNNTDADSLLTSTFLVGRFVPPLVFNYLNLIYEVHPSSVVHPTIGKFFGEVYVMPLIGDRINIYLPILIIIGALLTWSGCYSKVAILVGLQEAPDEDESSHDLQQRGLALVDRERKLALALSDRQRRTQALQHDLHRLRGREVKVDLDSLEMSMTPQGQRRARRKSRERTSSPTAALGSGGAQSGVLSRIGLGGSRSKRGTTSRTKLSPNHSSSGQRYERVSDAGWGDVQMAHMGGSDAQYAVDSAIMEGPLQKKTGKALRKWQETHTVLSKKDGLVAYNNQRDRVQIAALDLPTCRKAKVSIDFSDKTIFTVLSGASQTTWKTETPAEALQWSGAFQRLN